jgi:hypothetical protein
MTQISRYIIDTKVTGSDKWIGSDSQTQNTTKNFTPTKLAVYFNENQVIDIGTPIRYKYDILEPLDDRLPGTITFNPQVGTPYNFSSITTFILSKCTLKGNDVSEYLNFLVNKKILISNADNINVFGYYKLISLVENIEEPNFFDVTVSYLTGNGSIIEDNDYLISLIDAFSGDTPTKTSDLINDGEDGVHPFITLQDVVVPALQQVVNEGNSISNYGGIGLASIQSTNFTNNRILYLNNDIYPTIRLVDNANASHNLTIDLDTLNLNGTYYNWSDIVSSNTPTLDQVLAAGNTSLFDAKVGSLYLYDSTDVSYGYLSLEDGDFKLTSSYGRSVFIRNNQISFTSNSGFEGLIRLPNISTSRIYELPNQSGTIALTSDIPSTSTFVPYIGATSNINIGENSIIANNGVTNSEMSPALFAVENSAGTSYGLLEYNQLTMLSPAGSIGITASGITFPNASVQTTAFPPTGGTISQYIRGNGTLATFPTVNPSALTKTDDTNVTLTLGGTPATALLQGVSLTLGWTGTLADSRIASASNWNTAYTNRITSLTTTGSGAATLISNVLNIPTPSLSGYVPYTGANQSVNLGTNNLTVNNVFDGFTSVVASGTLITLTINSTPSYLVTGSGGQTIKMPNATTIPNGALYTFNNNQSSGAILVNNNSNTLIKSVPSGGNMILELIDNSTAAGGWDAHFQAPSNVSWSTNTFDYAGSITSATWNGAVVAINRGGTGSATQNFVDLTTNQTIAGAKTFSTAPILSSLTASQILALDSSGNIQSLPTATYPSLTELSYIKGSTSSIQTQLDAKALNNAVVHLAGFETITGEKTFSISPLINELTGNQILAIGTDKKILSLSTTIYPSLAELPFVKGVTSSIQTQLNAKQSTLVSGTNIKSINGLSLLGSGNLPVMGAHAIMTPFSGATVSASINISGAGSTFVGVANRLTVNPFIPAQTIISSSLYINVTVLGVGALAQIVIYSDLNGKPDTRLYQSTDLDCSTTGKKTVTTTQTFTAGNVYWIGIQTSSTQTITGIGAAGLIPAYITTVSMGTSYYITPTYGAAPTSFGTPSQSTGNVPFIGITI